MAARSSEPLATIGTHGASGYDRGCGCIDCRRGNRERQAKARARAKEKQSQPKVDHNTGQFELNVQAYIDEMGVQGAEAKLVADLMLFNARLLDAIPNSGRWHLSRGAQQALNEGKEQLRKLKEQGSAKPAGPDPESDLGGFINGLTQQN